MSLPAASLDLATLRQGYAEGRFTPSQLVEAIYNRIAQDGEQPVWISLVPREQAVALARQLENDEQARSLPLYGVPFAVKDNIDVAQMPTTAACPAYAYTPEEHSFVVEKLLAAGAILIGKTNMDQFATGLVGVRTPYGACRSVFNDKYISGGSSSGSAVAVAQGLVSFSLGTDTAGSGRVPAAFNNLVGLKPTRGRLSMTGVVPACRSLDCVSVFALTCGDAQAVLHAASGFDADDFYSRTPEAAPSWQADSFRVGVLPDNQREFFGDTEAARLYAEAIERIQALGGTTVEIDYMPFRASAELLYAGPWVAERLAAVGDFMEQHADEMHPVVRHIIAGAGRYTAVDVHQGRYRLASLQRETAPQWEQMDCMLLPTTGTLFTYADVEAEPMRRNTDLGYYTNFVNLMDLSAVAVPAGFRPNGLPFGVTLVGPAWTETDLLTVADQLHRANGEFIGGTRHALADTPALPTITCPAGWTKLAVVGAHLSGQPLNSQLTQRGAKLLQTCRTAPEYRLYALANTQPPKPGLVRSLGFAGPGMELEVWALSHADFGSFVAQVPPPMTIGTVLLEDGQQVKCFFCEPYALEGGVEITEFGGWRGYVRSLN